jgi:DNA-binding transcriptional LysR family regulator
MSALIDVDQLRTFIAIVETGSFTKAAEVVHKTQSAVSMQMKRLEERLGKAIFARDGRASKLTEDGDRLLDYARRIIKLNVEALAAFDDAELAGRVRLGLPDDYADRYLPEIMARFSRAYPSVELTVTCEPSGRTGRADRFQRARSGDRHRLRHLARVGGVPARAAACG